MDLAYHDDWQSARRHLEAWWANDAIDRAAIAVGAPRAKPLPGPHAPPTPQDIAQRWLDAEYRVAAADYHMRHTFYGGECLPVWWPNLGPGIAAAYLGVEPVFAPDTVWFNQHPHDWPNIEPRFAPDNKWWRATLDLIRTAVEASNGNFFVAVTDIGGMTDIEASLRGTMELLTDLVDVPHGSSASATRSFLCGFAGTRSRSASFINAWRAPRAGSAHGRRGAPITSSATSAA